MTSSPTPAVLPDARAREIAAQFGFHAPSMAMRKMIEHLIATPPASDAAVPAGEVGRLRTDLLNVQRNTAIYRQEAKDRADDADRRAATEKARADAAVELNRRLVAMMETPAAAPKVASDTAQIEIERLRGLLIDPGTPPWEDARAVLVTELRKAGYSTHAHNVEAAHGVLIPSDIALNLIAQASQAKVASDTGAIAQEWCLRMADLEAGQEIGAGALDHPLRTKCELPPAGWVCTREPGHDGPCAAVASDTGSGLREGLEALFEQAFADGMDAGKTGDESLLAGSAAVYAQSALNLFATPTDATVGATGGGEDKVTDAHLNAATTPGGDLLEQAAREKVEWLFDQAFADGVAVGKSGDDSILAGSSSAYAQAAIRALKPAGDGGEA